MKSRRLIRELKESLGPLAQSGRLAIQTEYVPMILNELYYAIKKGDGKKAIAWLDSLRVSND